MTDALPNARFSLDDDTLRTIVADALSRAREKGATESDAEVSEGYGQTVTVRKGTVETIEHNRDKGLGVSVMIGKQKGYASTSDLTRKAIADTVDAALSIARFTAADEANGLADPDLLARPEDIRDLDLFHPWDISVEHAIQVARRCEAAAFRLDPRITNSEGATVSSQHTQFMFGTSAGFLGGYPSTRHFVACSVIAQEGDAMQRDDWYSTTRSPTDLAKPVAIGDYAGRRALARLRSRKIATRETRVLLEAPIASSLLGHFVGAVSGGSLYRKASFLLDSLGTQVFSPIVNVREEPHRPRGQASTCFDDDGVLTRPRDVVRDGVLQGYFLGTYSARKLAMRSTGSAGGNHNLVLAPGDKDFVGMLREMGTGLLVTELMGQGINLVTGDYSRGAAGFWVENGMIQYPVEEITIAGNLRDMFRNIVAIGNDMLARGSRECGSVLIDGMTVAGN
jgi:PmbA protein